MSDSLPRVRDDLRTAKQESSGAVFFVVSDPATGKYIRLREPEHAILTSLDGATGARQIVEMLGSEFNIQVSEEAIHGFVARLSELGFLDRKDDLQEEQHRDEPSSRKNSVLYVRFNAFNPEKLLDRLYSKLRFLMSPSFTVFSVLVILAGVWQLMSLPGHIPYSLVDLIKVSTILTIIIASFVVIILHEFAHALVCRHYGGRVREMGFLLIYFQPAFYCNLSDSYMFPKKSQRVHTILAGMYLQVFLGSVSLLVWRIVKQGTALSDLLFVIVLVSFGTLVFNLNPLLKLDGYYFLADVLDIPNLRKKAFGFLKRKLTEIIFGIESDGKDISVREKRIYVAYSAASLIYTVLLLYFLGKLVMSALVAKWQGLGFLLFAAITLIIFRPLIMSAANNVKDAVTDGSVSRVKRSRWIVWSVIIVVVLLILIFVRTELKVTSPARLSSIESFTIRSPQEYVLKAQYRMGGIDQVRREQVCQLSTDNFSAYSLEPLVREGDSVNSSDTLLSVSTNLYSGELTELESQLKGETARLNLLLSDPKAAEIKKSESELEQARLRLSKQINDYARSRKMYDRDLISEDEWEKAKTEKSIAENEVEIALARYDLLKSGPKAEELSVVEAEIERIEARKQYLIDQISASTFIAPFSGVISSSGSESEVLALVRTDTMELTIAIPEEEIDVVNGGNRVILKVTGYPAKSFDGEVVRIYESAIGNGGDKVFSAVSVIPNPDGQLKPGMTGYAKVYCGKMSLGDKIIRRVMRFFRVEFWSWW